MKVVSEQILHKSDAGGVMVGLGTPEEAKQAFDAIVSRGRAYKADAVIEGVLVQKMASSGTEIIMGLNRYPVFGPLLMFGIGGIFVEVFQDVTFRLAPIGRNEARRMVRQIKGYKLLQGFRGRPKGDIETIEKCLVGLSNLAMNHPEIVELDINPLLVHAEGQGATAADCRMILRAPGSDPQPKH
jgi:acetyltransferase